MSGQRKIRKEKNLLFRFRSGVSEFSCDHHSCTMLAFVFSLLFQVQAQGMLTPQVSESRLIQDLSGVWQFRCDFDNNGIQQEWWKRPLQSTIPMPVPSSYNDITESAKIRDHIGWAWYQILFPLH